MRYTHNLETPFLRTTVLYGAGIALFAGALVCLSTCSSEQDDSDTDTHPELFYDYDNSLVNTCDAAHLGQVVVASSLPESDQ